MDLYTNHVTGKRMINKTLYYTERKFEQGQMDKLRMVRLLCSDPLDGCAVKDS